MVRVLPKVSISALRTVQLPETHNCHAAAEQWAAPGTSLVRPLGDARGRCPLAFTGRLWSIVRVPKASAVVDRLFVDLLVDAGVASKSRR